MSLLHPVSTKRGAVQGSPHFHLRRDETSDSFSREMDTKFRFEPAMAGLEFPTGWKETERRGFFQGIRHNFRQAQGGECMERRGSRFMKAS